MPPSFAHYTHSFFLTLHWRVVQYVSSDWVIQHIITTKQMRSRQRCVHIQSLDALGVCHLLSHTPFSTCTTLTSCSWCLVWLSHRKYHESWHISWVMAHIIAAQWTIHVESSLYMCRCTAACIIATQFIHHCHTIDVEYSELPVHVQVALGVWQRLSHTLHSRLVFFTRYTHVLCMMSHVTESYHTTGGGDRTSNNYDCQNFDQVFTESP